MQTATLRKITQSASCTARSGALRSALQAVPSCTSSRPPSCRQQHWQQLHSWQATCGRIRHLHVVRAEPSQDGSSSPSSSSPTSPIIQDSELAFLAKLVVLSVVGAAFIKYGSLLVSLPFEPNAAVAVGLVLGTPAAYSLYFMLQRRQQQ